MGRRKVKKKCTLCRFNHNETEKVFEVPKTVEEEFSDIKDEVTGATGGDPLPEAMSTKIDADETRHVHMPDQTALNELASLENWMNSRKENFESVIVNLVSGLTILGQATAKLESKATAACGQLEPKHAKSERCHSDSEGETTEKKEKKKQKKRFRHKNFLQRGESVDIDSLMMVMFRTMVEMQEKVVTHQELFNMACFWLRRAVRVCTNSRPFCHMTR